ncbi:hypothetical protein HYPSUDRAFT_48770 [Hypholoma sublateritium FD-334 SS-4]|uniref:Uncharacterized protein n=1 Tax=Hypholoma sublateritium (strain FD-334 SS-4) TaxID=945553 RepID=A0A0D2P2T0_HYPSF|nr:hypothetical protein HYPSUDRAFT_48770 [Hypholoma sublateritium FD-334 SS-4]
MYVEILHAVAYTRAPRLRYVPCAPLWIHDATDDVSVPSCTIWPSRMSTASVRVFL